MTEDVSIPAGDVTLPGLLDRPAGARWLVVLAHGAGAGMRHPFMADIAAALASRGVATLRWELPYMAAGRKRPDTPAVAVAAVRAACARARELAPELRLCAGGKSFGGRMTSTAIAAAPEPRVEGVVFLGFPLHPARAPSTRRAEHLAAVALPMLFLQGTRDALAEPRLLQPIVDGLGPRAAVRWLDGADHGFAVPRRAIAAGADAPIPWLAREIDGWLEGLAAAPRSA